MSATRRRRIVTPPAEEEAPAAEPRSRRRAAAAPAEEPRSRRRSRSYSDEDDVASASAAPLPTGWGSTDTLRKKAGMDRKFATEFTFTREKQIIKFLDDAPFVSYNQHWLDNRAGKKSFVCPQSYDQECPLCDYLDEGARTFTAFNIVVLPLDGGEPELQVVTAAVTLTAAIQTEAAQGDLTAGYYAVTKSGEKKATAYQLRPVKERDLEEDHDVAPLSDDELDELEEKRYTAETFPTRTSHEQLEEIAREMSI